MAKRYICPHCLRRFNYDNIWFRCFYHNGDDHERYEKKHLKAEEELNLGEYNPKGRKPAIDCYSNGKGVKAFRRRYVESFGKEDPDYPLSERTDEEIKALAEEIANNIRSGDFRYPIGKLDGKKLPADAECTYCGKLVHEVVCPSPFCRKHIEIDLNEEQYIINLVGEPGSGKSWFLGSLLAEISSNEFSAAVPEGIIELANETARTLVDEYKSGKIEKTNITRMDPAIIKFTPYDAGATKYSFIFYDVAGEIFNDGSRENANSSNADAAKQFSYPNFIIYIANPTHMSGPRGDYLAQRNAGFNLPESTKALFDNVSDGSFLTNSVVLMNAVRFIKNVIQNSGDREDSKKVDKIVSEIPIAACLTAMDTLQTVYSERGKERLGFFETIDYKDNYTGDAYAEEDEIEEAYNSKIKDASDNIKKSLSKFWSERPFVNEAETIFADNMFFAVGSCQTDKDGKTVYSGINIANPFLWIINQVCPDIIKLGAGGNGPEEIEDRPL